MIPHGACLVYIFHNNTIVLWVDQVQGWGVNACLSAALTREDHLKTEQSETPRGQKNGVIRRRQTNSNFVIQWWHWPCCHCTNGPFHSVLAPAQTAQTCIAFASCCRRRAVSLASNSGCLYCFAKRSLTTQGWSKYWPTHTRCKVRGGEGRKEDMGAAPEIPKRHTDEQKAANTNTPKV